MIVLWIDGAQIDQESLVTAPADDGWVLRDEALPGTVTPAGQANRRRRNRLTRYRARSGDRFRHHDRTIDPRSVQHLFVT